MFNHLKVFLIVILILYTCTLLGQSKQDFIGLWKSKNAEYYTYFQVKEDMIFQMDENGMPLSWGEWDLDTENSAIIYQDFDPSLGKAFERVLTYKIDIGAKTLEITFNYNESIKISHSLTDESIPKALSEKDKLIGVWEIDEDPYFFQYLYITENHLGLIGYSPDEDSPIEDAFFISSWDFAEVPNHLYLEYHTINNPQERYPQWWNIKISGNKLGLDIMGMRVPFVKRPDISILEPTLSTEEINSQLIGDWHFDQEQHIRGFEGPLIAEGEIELNEDGKGYMRYINEEEADMDKVYFSWYSLPFGSNHHLFISNTETNRLTYLGSIDIKNQNQVELTSGEKNHFILKR